MFRGLAGYPEKAGVQSEIGSIANKEAVPGYQMFL